MDLRGGEPPSTTLFLSLGATFCAHGAGGQAGVIHGFSGYFESQLHGDIAISESVPRSRVRMA